MNRRSFIKGAFGVIAALSGAEALAEPVRRYWPGWRPEPVWVPDYRKLYFVSEEEDQYGIVHRIPPALYVPSGLYDLPEIRKMMEERLERLGVRDTRRYLG